MTDRELLELAAKAAGYGIHDFTEDGGCWAYELGVVHTRNEEDPVFKWHPRDDNGDSFCLAVKLGVKVLPYPQFSLEKHSVEVARLTLAPLEDDENTFIGPQLVEDYKSDPYAATRRAIFLVAAAIGKAMP